ncbi:hypothetical protein ACM614_19690 [Streptomyces sp. 12297]
MSVETWVTGTSVAVGAAAAAALLAWKRPMLGKDGRYSTSRTFALAWSLVLAWMLLTLLGYALATGEGLSYFKGEHGPLDPLAPLYLLLLGGPYLAMFGAKGIVGSRVEAGRLVKPRNTGGASLRELVDNDAGRTDLADFQYVLFNGVALAYVVIPFTLDVSRGLPALPEEIALLTGGPALAYLTNKVVSGPIPVITGVRYENGELVVTGAGFRPGRAEPAVLLDGHELTGARTGDTSVTVAFEKPDTSAGPVTAAVTVITATLVESNTAEITFPQDENQAPATDPAPAPAAELSLSLSPDPSPADTTAPDPAAHPAPAVPEQPRTA